MVFSLGRGEPADLKFLNIADDLASFAKSLSVFFSVALEKIAVFLCDRRFRVRERGALPSSGWPRQRLEAITRYAADPPAGWTSAGGEYRTTALLSFNRH